MADKKEKIIIRIDEPLLTPEQEQMKWLGEATRNVKEKSALMNEAIGKKQFVATLRYASQMLAELRTGMLNPSHYYELYCTVFDQLTGLEMFFHDEAARGRTVDDMYEVVQHAGNIVPRLYLLITVGVVFIKSRQAPVTEIIRDLVEMCKGVQHPTRGLFLRHHLLTMLKTKLPDLNGEYEEDGSVEDSYNFILQNFKEMVWLWVRMENAKQQTKNRKEKERNQLRILVGYNIVRLSQLEGITKGIYRDAILPRILEIIMSYKEPLSQQYLLEVIIQVFPDEFHLYTLSLLLDSMQNVCKGVDIQAVLSALMDRLGNYVVGMRDGTTEGSGSKRENRVIAEMFEIFGEKIAALAKKEDLFTGATFAQTQSALINLAIKTYPGEYDRIDAALGNVRDRFANRSPDLEAGKALKKMLSQLMEELKDPNIVLDLGNFGAVVEVLPFKVRRDIAIALATTAANSDAKINTMDRVAKLFEVIAPLVYPVQDAPVDSSEIYSSPEEFQEEQSLVSRVLHTIDSDEMPVLMKMYSGARKQLGMGGAERLRITLKAMAFLYIKAAVRNRKLIAAGSETGVDVSKPFAYLHDPDGKGKGVLDVLSEEVPDECFSIYLAAANAADVCECEDFTYELLVRAFTIYEENAAKSREQTVMMSSIISSMCALRNLPAESYATLTTKVCQYTATFMQKHDQAVMASLCANMFLKPDAEAERVYECMKRATKLVSSSNLMNQYPAYVEILNQFLHLFAAQAHNIEARNIITAIELVREANDKLREEEKDSRSSADIDNAKVYYRNTAKYIRNRSGQDDRWQEIEM